MLQRCYRKSHTSYKHYGGRGIAVCDAWREDPDSFYLWTISSGYTEGLTLDRINVNGDYEPSNCRWIPFSEQSNNKRTNRLITYKGETKNVKQWGKIVELSDCTILYRLKVGWSEEKALTQPSQRRGRRKLNETAK